MTTPTQQIINAKKKLEEEIGKLLKAFREETGANIENIAVHNGKVTVECQTRGVTWT